MAGILKPDSSLLLSTGNEMTNYEILDGTSYKGSPQVLFDGIASGNISNSFYWYYNRNYFITIKINALCNFYRCSYTETNLKNPLVMSKLNEDTGEYEDVSSLYQVSITNGSGWSVFAKNVPAGIYKFASAVTTTRVDEEWFLEEVTPILIKSDSKYYSVKSEYYNSETGLFEPLNIPVGAITREDFNSYGFTIKDVEGSMTVGDETFFPLSKFQTVKFVTDSPRKLIFSGIKSQKEIVITNDITLPEFTKLNSINATYDKGVENGIYFSYSFDGINWIMPSSYTGENLVIPTDPYIDLSIEEKENLESSKNLIALHGFQIESMSEMDWTNIIKNSDGDNYSIIKFAFVLDWQSIETECMLKDISINYDIDGKFIQTTEPTISIQGDTVRIKPNMEKAQFKIILSL